MYYKVIGGFYFNEFNSIIMFESALGYAFGIENEKASLDTIKKSAINSLQKDSGRYGLVLYNCLTMCYEVLINTEDIRELVRSQSQYIRYRLKMDKVRADLRVEDFDDN